MGPVMSKKIMKGYMGSRKFFGLRYPHRVQNLMIREYSERNNYQYGMSYVELSVENCSYMLLDVIDKYQTYQGLAFFSIFLLPNAVKERESVYRLLPKGVEIHFVLEQIKMTSLHSIDKVENILSIKQHLQNTPLTGKYDSNQIYSEQWQYFRNYLEYSEPF